MRTIFRYIVFLLISLLLLNCSSSGDAGSKNPEDRSEGSIIIRFSESDFSAPATAITPGISMEIFSYDISGIGPGGATFTLNDITAGEASVNDLAAGAWAISIYAENTAGIRIGGGSKAIVVEADKTVSAEIAVVPLSGNGTLQISLSWPDGVVSDPSVESTVTPKGGTAAVIETLIASDKLSASYTDSALHTGYYLLITKLKDQDISVWGRVDSVRIIKDQTTSVVYPLTAGDINTAAGDIDIVIDPDMQNPVDITFTGETASINEGEHFTVSAATSVSVETFQWYLNGEALSGASLNSITLGENLGSGVYRLDLVVTKGAVISSKGFNFRVVEQEASVLWNRPYGGWGKGIVSDKNGNIYIYGNFRYEIDFDPGIESDSITAKNLDDIFITRINADGSYGWTKTIGNTGHNDPDSQYITDLKTDDEGNVYFTGDFLNTIDFNPGDGEDIRTPDGEMDGFITKLKSDGSYCWTKTFKGPDFIMPRDMNIDRCGSIYITGNFSGTADFNPSDGIDIKTSSGDTEVFLIKLDKDGAYQWTKTFLASYITGAVAINTDRSGNIYVGGNFCGESDFNPGAGIDLKHSNGGFDIFLTIFDSSGCYVRTVTIGGTGDDLLSDLSNDSNGNIYFTGSFNGSVDFNTGDGTDLKVSNGLKDIFISKITSGGAYCWTKAIGGTGYDAGVSLKISGDGYIYLTGDFRNTVDFNPDSGVDNKTSSSVSNLFLTRISINGLYSWTKVFGMFAPAYGSSVAIDPLNNIFFMGNYNSETVDADLYPDYETYPETYDILTKISK